MQVPHSMCAIVINANAVLCCFKVSPASSGSCHCDMCSCTMDFADVGCARVNSSGHCSANEYQHQRCTQMLLLGRL